MQDASSGAERLAALQRALNLTSQVYGRADRKVKPAVHRQNLSRTRKPSTRRDESLWDAFVSPQDFEWAITEDGVLTVKGGA